MFQFCFLGSYKEKPSVKPPENRFDAGRVVWIARTALHPQISYRFRYYLQKVMDIWNSPFSRTVLCRGWTGAGWATSEHVTALQPNEPHLALGKYGDATNWSRNAPQMVKFGKKSGMVSWHWIYNITSCCCNDIVITVRSPSDRWDIARYKIGFLPFHFVGSLENMGTCPKNSISPIDMLWQKKKLYFEWSPPWRFKAFCSAPGPAHSGARTRSCSLYDLETLTWPGNNPPK